jgi:hypothetical protein
MTLAALRRIALALPESTEEPHHEMTSFRVRGKIFATVPPEGGHVHIFVDEHAARGAVARCPGAVEELRWGKRPAGVRVRLKDADADLVRDLLEESWSRRAPRRLLRDRDERGSRKDVT